MLKAQIKQKTNVNDAHVRAVMMLLAVGVAVATAGVAKGQCMYEVEVIAAPPCQFGQSALIASGLNNLGEAVGRFSACPGCTPNCWDSAFYWSKATGIVPLPKPDGVTIMRAFDINDHQQIVGEVLYPGVAWRGFMYDMNTNEFHFLEPKFGVGMAVLNAINNQGIAVGARSITKGGNNPHNAVIWDTNVGKITDLGIPPNSQNSTARAITNNLHIAGTVGGAIPQQGWVNNSDNNIQLLGAIPEGTTSGCFDINVARIAACAGFLSPNPEGHLTQGAVWRNGEWELLPHLPGANSAGPLGINDIEQVVGSVGFPSGNEIAVLWQHSEVYQLNDLAKGSFTRAREVNNQGQILANSGTKGALLTPINVPLGDLNFDCRVDGHDLMILLESWGPVPRGARGARRSTPNLNADLNGDGVVDGADLLILLANWTF
jgi:uncharacterized membrane protein